MRRRVWLAVTSLLFATWLGWMAFLALTATRPIVISRPQLLISQIDVVAEVQAKAGQPGPEVNVRLVHWPPSLQKKLVNSTIHVQNLENCNGWKGEGIYILPLIKEGDRYRVAGIPPSPGFPTRRSDERPRIYPWTPQTQYQLEHIAKFPEAFFQNDAGSPEARKK